MEGFLLEVVVGGVIAGLCGRCASLYGGSSMFAHYARVLPRS